MTYKEAMLLAEKHQREVVDPAREVVDPAIEELKKIIREVINKKEDAEKIKQAEWEMEIYNDYRE